MISLTTEEYINRAKVIHNDKYDYSLVKYKNCRTNIDIICKKHGIFSQNPRHHVEKKSNCPLCRNEILSNKFSQNTEHFINKANKIHKNYYDYSKVNYINAKNKVIIVCPKHGEFIQLPYNHLNGSGCPSCKESLGEKKIVNFLIKNNINFKRQVSFSDLIGESGKLFFDFYLPEYKLLIEYDGIQHYKPINYFGGINQLNKQRNFDYKKIRYAIDNKYKLLKLSYITFDYLEEALYCELKNQLIL